MSDFPKGGDAQMTRDWLGKEGFDGLFVGWKADALLGQEEDDKKMIFSHISTIMLAQETKDYSFVVCWQQREKPKNQRNEKVFLITVRSCIF